MPTIFTSQPSSKPLSPLSPLSPKTLQPKTKPSHHLLAALVYRPQQVKFESQGKKEAVILLMRRHWVTNIGWILGTLIFLFLPLLFPSFPLYRLLPQNFRLLSVPIWYLFTFAFFLENFLNWYFNVYLITNERVVDIDFYSLIYKEISDTRIENIQDVTYSMGGLFRTLFNYGNILIQTAAEHPVFEFEAIPNPAWVVQKINEVIERKQK